MAKPNKHKPSAIDYDAMLAAEAARDRALAAMLADVGSSYSLLLERHADKPLWRLTEVTVDAKGHETRKVTGWLPFPEWSPELLLARGNLQRFVFSADPRLPREVGRQRGA